MTRFLVFVTLLLSQAGCVSAIRERADRMQWELERTNASLAEAVCVLHKMDSELATTNTSLEYAKVSLGKVEAELIKSNNTLKALTKGLGEAIADTEATVPAPENAPPPLKLRAPGKKE